MFSTNSAAASDAIVVYLDLETTGLDIANDYIVEIGLISCFGQVYTTVIHPPSFNHQDTPIHGIPEVELVQGPAFEVAFKRMVGFLQGLIDFAISDDGSSDDGVETQPRLKDNPPEILLAAHNGFKFDFSMLFKECHRNGVPLQWFTMWKYVDTLHVVNALDTHVYGGCKKLQCMLRGITEHQLRAHRALDDAIALREVVDCIAMRMGMSSFELLRNFVREIDLVESIAHLPAD